MTKIHRLPGHGHTARDRVPMEYVTLQHVRVGDELVEPGTLLTAEDVAGRNIGSMLRNRQIQQHIEPTAQKGARK